MKTTIALFIVLFMTSCNYSGNKAINIISNKLYSEKRCQVEINGIKNTKQIYLQMWTKNFEGEHYQYKVFKIPNDKSKCTLDIEIEKSSYYVQFSIADSSNILDEYGIAQSIIYNKDSTLNKYAYYEILDISDKKNYLNIIKNYKSHYIDDPIIYAFKWRFEAINNINDRNELRNDLIYIKKSYSRTGEYYLALSIGYYLLNDTANFNKNYNLASNKKLNVLNNDLVTGLIDGSLFSSNDSSFFKNIKNHHNTYKLVENNFDSYFALDFVTTMITTDRDSFNLRIINRIIDNQKYHHYQLLLSKFRILAQKYLPDSVNRCKLIENQFISSYDNQFDLFQKGFNASLLLLPNKSLFNEIDYWYNYKSEYYNRAISLTLNRIKNFKEKKYNSRIENLYKRLLTVSQKNSNEALKIFALCHLSDITKKNQEYNKTLFKIYENNNINVSFEKWRDNTMRNFEISELLNLVPVVNYNQFEYNSFQNHGIFIYAFVSNNCSICNIIFNDYMKNNEYYKKHNIKFVWIFEEKYRPKFSGIGKSLHQPNNYDKLINYFEVDSYPEVFLIKDGKIIDKIFYFDNFIFKDYYEKHNF